MSADFATVKARADITDDERLVLLQMILRAKDREELGRIISILGMDKPLEQPAGDVELISVLGPIHRDRVRSYG